MASLQRNAGKAFGNVAVFWYGPSKRYPNGTPHVAVPTGRQGYGKFEVEEYNYEKCERSYRWVSFADTRLKGFVTLK